MENPNIIENQITKWSIISLNIALVFFLMIINNHLLYDSCSTTESCGTLLYLLTTVILTIFEICIFNIIILYFLYIIQIGYKKIKTYLLKKHREKMMKEVDINENHINDSCCICLDDMERGVVLKCNHVLHKECLKELIEYNHKLCPLCCQDI